MDPDEVLLAMRAAIDRWEHAPAGSAEETQAGVDLTEAAGALDDWLSKGGFLPAEWQAVPDTAEACLTLAHDLSTRLHHVVERARALWGVQP